MIILDSFLYNWFKIVQLNGLLDEEDLNLLDDMWESVGRRLFYERAVILTIPCVIACIFSEREAVLYIFLAVGLFLIFPAAICLYVCYRWRRIDDEFHKFVSDLRQRELCLFGVEHLKSGNNPTQSCRLQRVKCLALLRRLVMLYTNSSKKLAAIQDEAEKLLLNFINDDLQILCAYKPNEREVDDDFLQISSLKSCRQYTFLVRSEFIRLSIQLLVNYKLTESKDGIIVSAKKYLDAIKLILKTIWVTAFTGLSIKTAPCKKERNCEKLYGKEKQISALNSCIIQLEWVLENLQTAKSLPDDSTALICCLQNVISVMSASPEHISHDVETSKTGDSAQELEGVVQPEVDVTNDLQAPHDNEDYQIFELDLQSEDGLAAHGSDDDMLKTPMEAIVDKRPLMCELRTVMEQRKEQCIMREMVALAKCRKVPLENIRREELDREFDDLNKPDLEDRNSTHKQRGDLSCHAFGGMPTVGDLQSILKERGNFFSSKFAQGDVFGNDENGSEESDNG
ncbi:hypothetical protein DdX_07732 [Ditylenchus destructor]|uniref:Vezatin n=1 Tax=Ditylenchus destructor TaxID=166010 RepID=A0AAD4R7T0_9BILA|nr:hypothetical protein DdX_07732 [Ditylenchus destructor]